MLVRAYPPGARRAELLDTMLLAAHAESRTRPTLREIADILRRAPRARLGRPGSRGVVPLAVVVALLFGVLGVTVAARLGDTTHRPLPGDAEMAAIVALAAPGIPLALDQRHDDLHLNGNGELTYGQVAYRADQIGRVGEPAGFTAAAAARLSAAGWRAGPPDGGDGILTVDRDGLVLTLQAFDAGEASAERSHVWLTVRRAEAPGLLTRIAAGGVAGLLIGWLLAGWASRRTEARPVVSATLTLLVGATAFLALPLIIYSAFQIKDIARYGYATDEGPFWSWTTLFEENFLAAAPALLTAVAALLVVLFTRPGGPAVPARVRRIPAAVIPAVALGVPVYLALLTVTGLWLPFATALAGVVLLLVVLTRRAPGS